MSTRLLGDLCTASLIVNDYTQNVSKEGDKAAYLLNINAVQAIVRCTYIRASFCWVYLQRTNTTRNNVQSRDIFQTVTRPICWDIELFLLDFSTTPGDAAVHSWLWRLATCEYFDLPFGFLPKFVATMFLTQSMHICKVIAGPGRCFWCQYKNRTFFTTG